MDLILWRHAHALASRGELPADDMARALSPKGEKQARRMAKWLERQLPEGTQMLVSPARRTEQTAAALGIKFKRCAEIGPQASAAQILSRVQWPQAGGTVLLVGHQPALGQVVAHLLGWPDSEFDLAKGSVWWLRSLGDEANARASLLTVQSPYLL